MDLQDEVEEHDTSDAFNHQKNPDSIFIRVLVLTGEKSCNMVSTFSIVHCLKIIYHCWPMNGMFDKF